MNKLMGLQLPSLVTGEVVLDKASVEGLKSFHYFVYLVSTLLF